VRGRLNAGSRELLGEVVAMQRLFLLLKKTTQERDIWLLLETLAVAMIQLSERYAIIQTGRCLLLGPLGVMQLGTEGGEN
jgi:hypothetical protein